MVTGADPAEVIGQGLGRERVVGNAAGQDDLVYFEELGIDSIMVDEAHFYKNLFLFTKMNNVSGLSTTDAQKSSDLYLKCRYLDEITGGKGVVFATGTPISNSMTEMYTMQRYLQYSTLLSITFSILIVGLLLLEKQA